MYELAFDEDGDPISIPAHATGWRVRRSMDGRGRPPLVHVRGSGGKTPLVLALDATHDDLLREAGPGRYRLDAIDAGARRIEECPTACVGPLGHGDEDEGDDDSSTGNRDGMSAVLRMLGRAVTANTRLAEGAVGKVGTVMDHTAQLLQAAHAVRLPMRVVTTEELDADDSLDCDAGEAEMAPAADAPMLHPLIEHLIDKVVQAAVPHVMGRLAEAGVGLGGVRDWRLATSATVSPSPAVKRADARAVADGSPIAPGASVITTPRFDRQATQPSAPVAASSQTESVAQPKASAGAASSEFGAALAAKASPDDLNAHVLAVWQTLSSEEQAAASFLISRLTPEERASWVAELAGCSVGEATARVRAVLPPSRPATAPRSLAPALPAPDLTEAH